MSLQIIIKGRVPSKKNSRNLFVRGGKLFNIPSKRYKEWHNEASKQIENYIPTEPIQKVKHISIHFWAPDKRKTDLTNKAESILDLLVDSKVIADDNWFIVNSIALFFAEVDREDPRCEIAIIA